MVAPGDMGWSAGQATRKACLVHREAHHKPLQISVNVLTIPPKVLPHNHTLGTGLLQEEAPCPTRSAMPDAPRQFTGWMPDATEMETVFLYSNPVSDLRNNSVVSMLMLRQT
jgi:hypothetical protein